MLFLPYQIDLTEIDLHIYKYICANYRKVIQMKIRDLAEATHVSTTTVLRFCHKFECEGYSEFKYKLRQYLKQSQDIPFHTQGYDQNDNISFLNRLSHPDYQNALNTAAEFIVGADLIVFIGLGASGITARYGVHLFSTIVSFSLLINEPLNMPMHLISEKINKNLCFIILSVTGEQEEIINFIEHESIANNKFISITNGASSSLAKAADLNLAYHIPLEMYGEMNITSQIPAIAILETLARKAFYLKNKKTEPDSEEIWPEKT